MGWPRGVPMQRRLTDTDLALLASADASVSTVELAERLAKPYFTVAHTRQRMRRLGGWYCPVAVGTCSECGGLLLTSPDHRRTAHVACQAARAARYSRVRRREGRASPSTAYVVAWRLREPERNNDLREREKARRRASWPELPIEERQAMLARVHAADARDCPVTAAQAYQCGAPWTAEEDRYLREHPREPARDVALLLGRTLWAVRGRRVRLRRKDGQVTDGGAGRQATTSVSTA